MGLADFAGANSNGWPTGPVSIFRNRVNARLFRYNSPSFDFLIETEPVGHPLEFEPAKSANPTRFLSKIDQYRLEGGGDVFQRPREKKPAKVLKNPVLFSGTIIVGLTAVQAKKKVKTVNAFSWAKNSSWRAFFTWF